jgi:DNA-binding NarL/FixJ family response regulator
VEPSRSRRSVPVSILVAEMNFLGADLMSSALKRCQNQFDVVACAADFTVAAKKVEELRPHIALISVSLQGEQATGYKLISHIRENWPKTATVALLNDSHLEHVLEAFRCGARGVISRDQPFRTLAKCIRKVHEGHIWASSDQIGFVFESLKKGSENFSARSTNGALSELTPREKDVAALVIEGLRNAEIAIKLNVSEHTVRNYIMKIYDKLGVSNRVQLTRQCAGTFERRSGHESSGRAGL